MRIDILTLFPSMFAPLRESIIGKAIDKGLIDLKITDIRDFARDKHRTADDTPYGGGPGMVIKPDVVGDAIKATRTKGARVIYLSPSGVKFDQKKAEELSKLDSIMLICGHYEGLDQRAIDELVDEQVSAGDYVLTGGELPAMTITDAVARLIPGVLGGEESAIEESFSSGILEYPQYTKPAEYGGAKVPEVLKGGNHKEISEWRRAQAVRNTFFNRPDLLAKTDISQEDMRTLEGIFLKGNS